VEKGRELGKGGCQTKERKVKVYPLMKVKEKGLKGCPTEVK
jgi:hypothetical protein